MVAAIGQMSTGTMLVIGLVIAIATAVLGGVTNMILQDRGFGAVVNGILMLSGFAAGAWVRLAVFPS